MKKPLFNILAIVIWLLPIVYLLTVYSSLPAIVPLHYGISGKPDGFGNKDKFLAIQLVLAFISGGVYLLLKYVPAIDKGQAAKYGEGTFDKVAIGVLLFLSAISIAITLSTINKAFNGVKLVFPAVSLLFAFLGNMMYNVKQNHFFGIRVPWTLNNEDNWRATHRLAGKLWFAGGIILTALVLFLPTAVAAVVFLVFIFAMSFIPIIYSYRYYLKHRIK